ncbi:MAG TPA: ATP-binding protein, partial [Candidatus Sulfotelmatobacter sp.]|nr:ATP-binding protein [Candidatus Sulfotelmatobacter sp.]
MSTAPQSVSFIGRQDITRRLMDRFQRPDDLRNNPEEFVQPGFYGLAGTGKTRLLDELAKHARRITPYVVKIDFDTSSGGVTPRTPLSLASYLIDILEEKDRCARSFLKQLLWRWWNPFKRCRCIVEQIHVTQVTQTVHLHASQASNITQNISLNSQIPENLSQAFAGALTRLHAQSQTNVLFGNFGQAQRFPLILVILDTVELASRSIREWLPQMTSLLGGRNTLKFHLMFVLAGRYRQAGVMETLLPPLETADSKAFISEY